jgi:dolichol-phosphate mannosyltransferase
MELSIILPTLNEADNIGPLISDLNSLFSSKVELEIIVIDDLSTDDTAHQVNMLSSQFKNLLFFQRAKPDGLVNAIKYGISQAQGKYICWMDADGSMPASTLLEMWNVKSENFDIIIASRFISGGGFKGVTENSRNPIKVWRILKQSNDSYLAMVLSRILNIYLRVLFSNRIKDYTSGFILIQKAKLRINFLQGIYGEYFPIFLFKSDRIGLKVHEIPYINLPRKHGKSKTGTTLTQLIRTGIPYVTSSFKTKFSFDEKKLRANPGD